MTSGDGQSAEFVIADDREALFPGHVGMRITVPLDTPDAQQSAALACGYPDWQSLLDAAQEAEGQKP